MVCSRSKYSTTASAPARRARSRSTVSARSCSCSTSWSAALERRSPAWRTCLGALGFAKAGAHKSKAVTRWRQGDINIVVNCEKEGFAHSYNITHGSAVCALALKVDDAAAALARAGQLLDQPFRQLVKSGEIYIPAVRGLGGSLLYFTDDRADLGRHWEIDFDAPRNASDGAGAGLTAVDHLAQSM